MSLPFGQKCSLSLNSNYLRIDLKNKISFERNFNSKEKDRYEDSLQLKV